MATDPLAVAVGLLTRQHTGTDDVSRPDLLDGARTAAVLEQMELVAAVLLSAGWPGEAGTALLENFGLLAAGRGGETAAGRTSRESHRPRGLRTFPPRTRSQGHRVGSSPAVTCPASARRQVPASVRSSVR